MSTKIIVEREIGNRMMRFETGQVAKQASGCVMVTYGDTVVMCTAMRANPRPGLDFFPLQCDYRERTSAAGKFPGGFRKREGAPNEKEILTMRLMDRPIRPLFPDGYVDECQIQAWVMSHDGENDADIIACTGASAALCLTDSPFEGPVATVRIGRIMTDDGETYVLNPTQTQMQYSDLDLVLSGHCDGVNMIEIGAAQVDEACVMGAIKFGYEEGIKPILELQNELAEKAGTTEKRMGDLALPSEEVTAKVAELVKEKMLEARRIGGKEERNEAVNALRESMIEEHFALPEDASYTAYMAAEKTQREAKEAFRKLEKKCTRQLIVDESTRADGREFNQIRDLEMETKIFPRTHGSAFFQRGETQSLVTCTLGTGKDEQIVDGLMPEYAKKFYLHYNFPPFCTGEAGRIMGPGRREIGHGALAERSLLGILPDVEEFPYTIRLVSDITESNGSSSMASVCGGCLALMDAGVPIQSTCAGISVGRFSNDEGKVIRVMDIIGEEDFFGDMDFKVCGTKTGITGVQLDLKARGLWFDELEEIFEMARKGRHDIIDQMEGCIPAPRSEMSEYAPRMISIAIDPEKIGKLIGPGGKTIRQITEDTGATIDINDDGIVFISSVNMEAAESAKAAVEAIAAEIKVGSVFEGKVVSTRDFGAFIEIAPGTDGMCHISELADGFVEKVENICKVGDKIKVKVINVDDTGRIKLSVKALLKDAEKENEASEEKAEAETVEN
ncbi:MAG: polyribonucleotide nucleotidyltransferase [Phycisphaerales bacterium]|nr:polyribonucleotide nucleotidyltransferase [Phycisphaerales bacterium]